MSLSETETFGGTKYSRKKSFKINWAKLTLPIGPTSTILMITIHWFYLPI